MTCPRNCGATRCTHGMTGRIPTTSTRTGLFGKSKPAKPKR